MTTLIEQTLLDRYGPLMSVAQLAKMLDRSPEGLRIGLRTRAPWAAEINAARLRIGRRVYFRTPDIAAIIASDSHE